MAEAIEAEISPAVRVVRSIALLAITVVGSWRHFI
jgi:hypothetical protein